MEELKFSKATNYNLKGIMKKAQLKKSVNCQPGIESYRLLTVNCLNGFTLLEIMIALAIVGAVVITVLQTVMYHADVAYEHTVTTRMYLLAKEKITEMELNPNNVKDIIAGTDFTYENLVNSTDDEGILEIKTVIRGYGKEVFLNELILKKEMHNQK
ncbi:MAG: prepilin-type N-terminal cleavage/methylation domain-containing protein [Thermodesulfovibrionia bacterium]|nr:prepilin-type N-terminal cleavage/methylation domain-containing protein [Thermodesulfovibrionia bacterium]